MTGSSQTLLDRAFPGENYRPKGGLGTDMKCSDCMVEWLSRVGGDNCWVCGNEGTARYITPSSSRHPYAMAMAAAYAAMSEGDDE